MAYHGYIPVLKQYFIQLIQAGVEPSFLEIGVDRGVTFLSLVTFLSRATPNFKALGVDVKIQESTQIQLQNLDLQETQVAQIVSGNSLDVIPMLASGNAKFDMILLDGDHNYYTVKRELDGLVSLLNEHGSIIVDDYDGKWSDKDLWYSERPEYADVESATKKVETEKQGVKAAVDEWLEQNPEWKLVKMMQGEPVVLSRHVPTQEETVETNVRSAGDRLKSDRSDEFTSDDSRVFPDVTQDEESNQQG